MRVDTWAASDAALELEESCWALCRPRKPRSETEARHENPGMCQVVLFVQNIFCPLLQGPSLAPLYWKVNFLQHGCQSWPRGLFSQWTVSRSDMPFSRWKLLSATEWICFAPLSAIRLLQNIFFQPKFKKLNLKLCIWKNESYNLSFFSFVIEKQNIFVYTQINLCVAFLFLGFNSTDYSLRTR